VSPGDSGFDEVWRAIQAHAGEFFRTKGGRWFTYRVQDDSLVPSHSGTPIPRSDFQTAHQIVPFPSPGKIARFVEGPEYVWAILHDERIAQGRWLTPPRAPAARGSSGGDG
jgi:hypothetical protein